MTRDRDGWLYVQATLGTSAYQWFGREGAAHLIESAVPTWLFQPDGAGEWEIDRAEIRLRQAGELAVLTRRRVDCSHLRALKRAAVAPDGGLVVFDNPEVPPGCSLATQRLSRPGAVPELLFFDADGTRGPVVEFNDGRWKYYGTTILGSLSLAGEWAVAGVTGVGPVLMRREAPVPELVSLEGVEDHRFPVFHLHISPDGHELWWIHTFEGALVRFALPD